MLRRVGKYKPSSGNPSADVLETLRKEYDGAQIFFCASFTINECIARALFGHVIKDKHVRSVADLEERMSRVKGGKTLLFLWLVKERILMGVWVADGDAKLNIEPRAWGGGFPRQVRTKEIFMFHPLPDAILKKNLPCFRRYDRFLSLSSEEAKQLVELFITHHKKVLAKPVLKPKVLPPSLRKPQKTVVKNPVNKGLAKPTKQANEAKAKFLLTNGGVPSEILPVKRGLGAKRGRGNLKGRGRGRGVSSPVTAEPAEAKPSRGRGGGVGGKQSRGRNKVNTSSREPEIKSSRRLGRGRTRGRGRGRLGRGRISLSSEGSFESPVRDVPNWSEQLSSQYSRRTYSGSIDRITPYREHSYQNASDISGRENSYRQRSTSRRRHASPHYSDAKGRRSDRASQSSSPYCRDGYYETKGGPHSPNRGASRPRWSPDANRRDPVHNNLQTRPQWSSSQSRSGSHSPKRNAARPQRSSDDDKMEPVYNNPQIRPQWSSSQSRERSESHGRNSSSYSRRKRPMPPYPDPAAIPAKKVSAYKQETNSSHNVERSLSPGPARPIKRSKVSESPIASQYRNLGRDGRTSERNSLPMSYLESRGPRPACSESSESDRRTLSPSKEDIFKSPSRRLSPQRDYSTPDPDRRYASPRKQQSLRYVSSQQPLSCASPKTPYLESRGPRPACSESPESDRRTLSPHKEDKLKSPPRRLSPQRDYSTPNSDRRYASPRKQQSSRYVSPRKPVSRASPDRRKFSPSKRPSTSNSDRRYDSPRKPVGSASPDRRQFTPSRRPSNSNSVRRYASPRKQQSSRSDVSSLDFSPPKRPYFREPSPRRPSAPQSPISSPDKSHEFRERHSSRPVRRNHDLVRDSQRLGPRRRERESSAPPRDGLHQRNLQIREDSSRHYERINQDSRLEVEFPDSYLPKGASLKFSSERRLDEFIPPSPAISELPSMHEEDQGPEETKPVFGDENLFFMS